MIAPTDPETIKGLDFDVELPCSWREPDTHPATHIAFRSCCGEGIPICYGHHRLERILWGLMAPMCPSCGEIIRSGSLYSHLEPI